MTKTKKALGCITLAAAIGLGGFMGGRASRNAEVADVTQHMNELGQNVTYYGLKEVVMQRTILIGQNKDTAEYKEFEEGLKADLAKGQLSSIGGFSKYLSECIQTNEEWRKGTFSKDMLGDHSDRGIK